MLLPVPPAVGFDSLEFEQPVTQIAHPEPDITRLSQHAIQWQVTLFLDACFYLLGVARQHDEVDVAARCRFRLLASRNSQPLLSTNPKRYSGRTD